MGGAGGSVPNGADKNRVPAVRENHFSVEDTADKEGGSKKAQPQTLDTSSLLKKRDQRNQTNTR